MAQQLAQPSTVEAAFHSIVSARLINCVYQPIVRLADEAVVGFEALARGPAGTAWEHPITLIRYAAVAGRLPELDWVCRAAAIRGALQAELPAQIPLFINIEPVSSRSACPPDLWPIIDAGVHRLQIVVEVTERAVRRRPGRILATATRLRHEYGNLALDDVGADAASEALMPLLNPDIIKLDRSITQAATSSHAVQVITSARRQAHRTGALILAEGIETEAHLAAARALGAALGQGWRWGRPAPQPLPAPPMSLDLPHLATPVSVADTPFDTAQRQLTTVAAHRTEVEAARRSVENHASRVPEPKVLLATLAAGEHTLDDNRYQRLATRTAITGLFGPHLADHSEARSRIWTIHTTGVLANELDTLSIASSGMMAMFARPSHDNGDEHYDMITTTDPDLIVQAAQPLLSQLQAAPLNE